MIKNLILIFILFCKFKCNEILYKSIIDKSVGYSNIDGMQLLLIDNVQSKFYCSLTGSKTVIIVDCQLFLTDSKDEIDKNNGVWAAIGFGSTTMVKADMITFHYWTKGSSSSMSADCWVEDSSRIVKLDIEQNEKSGKNHVTEIFFETKVINVNGYKTRINWKVEKNLENLDPFDWKDISNWQTNKGNVYGAWGYNDLINGQMQYHQNPTKPPIYILVDGQGLKTDVGVVVTENTDNYLVSNTVFNLLLLFSFILI